MYFGRMEWKEGTNFGILKIATQWRLRVHATKKKSTCGEKKLEGYVVGRFLDGFVVSNLIALQNCNK